MTQESRSQKLKFATMIHVEISVKGIQFIFNVLSLEYNKNGTLNSL